MAEVDRIFSARSVGLVLDAIDELSRTPQIQVDPSLS